MPGSRPGMTGKWVLPRKQADARLLVRISKTGLFPRPSRRCMRQVMSKDVLSRLAAIIKSRRQARAGDSHTRRLLDEAPIKPGKKLGEEAIEGGIAALAQDKN